jgi:hypothetical protein
MTVQLPKLEGYVIYNPATGLFAKKGDHGWSKSGNVWRTLPHLKNHIQQKCVWVDYNYDPSFIKSATSVTIRVFGHYKGCVVMDLTTGQEAPLKIEDYCRQVAERKAEQHRKYKTPYNVSIEEDK